MCSVYKHTVNPCCLCSSCSQRNKHTLTNTQSIIWEIWHHWCKDPVNNRRLVLAASVFSEQHASCHILTEKKQRSLSSYWLTVCPLSSNIVFCVLWRCKERVLYMSIKKHGVQYEGKQQKQCFKAVYCMHIPTWYQERRQNSNRKRI